MSTSTLIPGILGAVIYAIGDVLLLAGKASFEDYPKLKPYAKLYRARRGW